MDQGLVLPWQNLAGLKWWANAQRNNNPTNSSFSSSTSKQSRRRTVPNVQSWKKGLRHFWHLKQSNRRYKTSPALCNPTPPSRPIGRIACAPKFTEYYFRLPGILNDPFCCMALLAIELSLLQQCCSDRCSEDWQCVGMARTTPAKLPLPLEGSALPSSTWLLWPKSSSETASRSVQPFLYGSQMLCCTMHC